MATSIIEEKERSSINKIFLNKGEKYFRVIERKTTLNFLRKKMIEKLNIEEIKPSSRRYPAIIFEQERDAGDQILELKSLSYENDGETYFKDISFNLNKGEKVLILSKNSRSVNLFYDCISGSLNPTDGSFNWGVTTSFGYLPMDNHSFFDKNISLVDWLRQWANNDEEREELFIRSFLGRMLFGGDEALKSCNVLSGLIILHLIL